MINKSTFAIILLATYFYPINVYSQSAEIIRNGTFDTLNFAWQMGHNAGWRKDTQTDTFSFSPPYCGEVNSNIMTYTDGEVQQVFYLPDYTRSVKVKFNYIASPGGGPSPNDAFLVGIFDPWSQDVGIDFVYLYNSWSNGWEQYQRELTPKEIFRIYQMGQPRFNMQGTGLNAFRTSFYRIDNVSLIGTVGAPAIDFGCDDQTIWEGNTIDFFDSSSAQPTDYQWKFFDGSPGLGYQISYEQNPTNIKYDYAGIYDVSLTVSNPYGSETKVKQGFIKVKHDNTGIGKLNGKTYSISTFPNPVLDLLNIELKDNLIKQPIEIEVLDQIGQIVMTDKISIGTNRKQYDFTNYSSGIYSIHIITRDGKSLFLKVLKK